VLHKNQLSLVDFQFAIKQQSPDIQQNVPNNFLIIFLAELVNINLETQRLELVPKKKKQTCSYLA
jgi:hypothetical protein